MQRTHYEILVANVRESLIWRIAIRTIWNSLRLHYKGHRNNRHTILIFSFHQPVFQRVRWSLQIQVQRF